MTGLRAYDLQPPARLLVPGPHKRRNYRERLVKLGSGEDAATLVIATWDACLPGCTDHDLHYDAGRSVRLKVPCDALPHCQYCECGDGHTLLLTDEQFAELQAALS